MSLATIADRTKIKASLLDGLERDDVSHWPAGLFRRAFVRAYARTLDLDPDVIVGEFLALYPDPVDGLEIASTLASGVNSPRPPTRLRYLIGAAIGALSRFRLRTVGGHKSAQVDREVTNRTEVKASSTPTLDLAAAARLCTELGRVESVQETTPILPDIARLFDAVGLIVWVWDPQASVLKPVLTHGYSDQLLAQWPNLKRDADNATAATFRSGHTSTVSGSERAHGALVAPLITAAGCLGVLAIELRHRDRAEGLHSLVTIVAAQLARIIGVSRPAEVPGRRSGLHATSTDTPRVARVSGRSHSESYRESRRAN